MDWLENQISRFFQIRFSRKAVCVVFVVLVGSHSSELRINHRLFFRFLSLLGRFWKFLRASLNDMNWFGNQISRFFHIRFSGKAVCVVFVVLVGSPSSELRINHRLFF